MIRMMTTVVVIYALCWLPFHALTLFLDAYPSLYSFPYIQHLWLSCHFIAMSSLCYNPFVYFYMSSKFSEAFLRSCLWRFVSQLFAKCFCRHEKKKDNNDNTNLQLTSNSRTQRFKLLPTYRRCLSNTCSSKVVTSSKNVRKNSQ